MRISSRFTTDHLPPALLTLGLALVLFGAIKGVDYGHHWDEIRILESAVKTAEGENLLPGWYNYPSLSHDLVVMVHSTYWLDNVLPGKISGEKAEETLYLRARILFILLAYSLMLALYFLGKRISGSAWTGLLASIIAGSSFELAYHARWVAPDALMAALGTFSVWQAYRYYQSGTTAALIWSAILAGLTLSSKYPGGLIFLPLLLAILMRQIPEGKPWNAQLLFQKSWKPMALALGIGCGLFLLTTPGILFDSQQFFYDLRFELEHYKEGHGRHTVKGFFDHAWKMILYLDFHALSPYDAIALLLAICALLGIAELILNQRRAAWILLSFPLVYSLYFMSQKAMIVRNYLILLPFLALFAAIGIRWIYAWLEERKPAFAYGLSLVVIVGLCLNLHYHLKAAHSIVKLKTPDSFFVELDAYVKRKKKTTFLFSQGVRSYWQQHYKRPLPDNVIPQPLLGRPYKVIFFSREFEKYWRFYKVNQFDYVERIVGSQDVNFNYYPEWQNEKIVVMESQYASDLPLKY